MLVVCIHLTAALLFVHRVLPHFTTRLAGFSGDSAQFAWGLTYTPWALLHGHTPLLTDRVIAPDGVNLMWNTTTPLLGLLATPFSLGLGPVASYNLVLIAVLVANGLSCYLAFRRFISDRFARGAASLFWAYSGYVVAHASGGHLNLAFIALIPPLFVLLHELAIRQVWDARRTGILLGLVLGAQLLVSADLLLMEAVAAAVGLLLAALLAPSRISSRLHYLVRGCVPALLLFALMSVYPLWVQFRGPQRITAGTLHPAGVYVADLRSLIVPTLGWLRPPAYLRGPSHWTGGFSEWNSYLGVPLLVIVFVTAVVLRRRRAVVWAALFAVFVTVLSFGPRLHIDGVQQGPQLPWALASDVPGLKDLIPSRLAVFGDLAVALLLAVALESIRHQRPRIVRGCGLMVGTTAALTVVPASLPTSSAVTPPFFASTAVKQIVPANSIVLVLPLSAEGTGTIDDVSALVWQAQAQMSFRMAEGYWLVPASSTLHQGEPQIGPNRTPLIQALLEIQDGRPVSLPVSDVAAALQAQGVQRVLLGPMSHRDAMVAYLTAALGPANMHVGGIDVWLPSHWTASALKSQAMVASVSLYDIYSTVRMPAWR